MPIRLPAPARPPDRPPSESFHCPLKGAVVLSSFGWRRHEFHTGIDLRARRGRYDAVYASRAGRVILARRTYGYGKMVIIEHADGYLTRYAHLSHISVWNGKKVRALQEIGRVGETGRATTQHLHFEIMTPSHRFINPAPLIFPEPDRQPQGANP